MSWYRTNYFYSWSFRKSAKKKKVLLLLLMKAKMRNCFKFFSTRMQTATYRNLTDHIYRRLITGRSVGWREEKIAKSRTGGRCANGQHSSKIISGQSNPDSAVWYSSPETQKRNHAKSWDSSPDLDLLSLQQCNHKTAGLTLKADNWAGARQQANNHHQITRRPCRGQFHIVWAERTIQAYGHCYGDAVETSCTGEVHPCCYSLLC